MGATELGVGLGTRGSASSAPARCSPFSPHGCGTGGEESGGNKTEGGTWFQNGGGR